MYQPNSEELRLMLIDHMKNMLNDPKPVDVDYGENLLDRIIGSFVNDKLESMEKKVEEIFPCDCRFLKGFAFKTGDPCDGTCVTAVWRNRLLKAISEEYMEE